MPVNLRLVDEDGTASPVLGARGASSVCVKKYAKAAFWGFFWGYPPGFVLCMALLVVGIGHAELTANDLLDLARRVFFSKAQYVFLGIGTYVALYRASIAGVDKEKLRNETRLEGAQEAMDSLWENWPK